MNHYLLTYEQSTRGQPEFACGKVPEQWPGSRSDKTLILFFDDPVCPGCDEWTDEHGPVHRDRWRRYAA